MVAAGTDAPPGTPGAATSGNAKSWLVGTALGLAVVGPVLSRGVLLNLDLVATKRVPLPSAVWGLGPELPRRVPTFVPLALLSNVLDGALLVKVAMVAIIATAFVGMLRLCRDAPPIAAVAAAMVYGVGPFLTTRLMIGHLPTAVATAVLPWAVPTLLRPASDVRRTLLWCAAMSAGGVNGATLALAAIVVGVIADGGKRVGSVAGAWLLPQLTWLVPGIIVMSQGVHPTASDAYRTSLHSLGDVGRLLAGQGFWLPQFEIGRTAALVPMIGIVLLIFAVRGVRQWPEGLSSRASALGALGFIVAAGSAVPVVDDLYGWFASTTPGAPLREGHRVLALFLVWLLPAAAMGTGSLSPRRWDWRPPAFFAAAIVLAASAVWGFGGRLEPVRLPVEWSTASDAIDADPGTVLPLPWSQYLRPAIIDQRLVYNPLAYYLDADVLLPSGRGVADVSDEFADPRIPAARAAVDELVHGAGTRGLVRLGIRWVAVVEPSDISAQLLQDQGLQPVVQGATLSLFRVPAVHGRAVAANGSPLRVDALVGPLERVEGHSSFTWYRPGATGWMRGFAAGHIDRDGLEAFDAGSGVLWYWPSLVAVLGHVIAIGAVVRAAFPVVRRRPVVALPHS